MDAWESEAGISSERATIEPCLESQGILRPRAVDESGLRFLGPRSLRHFQYTTRLDPILFQVQVDCNSTAAVYRSHENESTLLRSVPGSFACVLWRLLHGARFSLFLSNSWVCLYCGPCQSFSGQGLDGFCLRLHWKRTDDLKRNLPTRYGVLE
jgi:hypothetical protein